MKDLFVDTSGWKCLVDSAESKHEEARKIRDEVFREGGRLISTDYVMDETLTLIRTRLGLHAAKRWWESVESNPQIVWNRIDPARAELSRHWMFRWTDKEFSFTDCTSFIVMRELGLTRALTTDRHFTMAGFELLP